MPYRWWSSMLSKTQKFPFPAGNSSCRITQEGEQGSRRGKVSIPCREFFMPYYGTGKKEASFVKFPFPAGNSSCRIGDISELKVALKLVSIPCREFFMPYLTHIKRLHETRYRFKRVWMAIKWMNSIHRPIAAQIFAKTNYCDSHLCQLLSLFWITYCFIYNLIFATFSAHPGETMSFEKHLFSCADTLL